MISYAPRPSVTVVRVFSMRAGLLASTVTPGSTAPELSLTTPAIEAPWACASAGIKRSTTKTSTAERTDRDIRPLLELINLPRVTPAYTHLRSDCQYE